ncbi:MAG: histone deacetylase [Acidobacteria bacterium]|jgi:acetoin utilization deacetylase AcuC-like enzyme|nr:MAG: histone deacetylase [Acidobacteriota bacterium]GIU82855.1 MAG: histone deacetylase [Pyrinomonadaceae bacterium]
MSSYKIFYSPYYYADIGETHVFPIRKFELVRDKLLAEGTITTEEIIEPEPVSIEDLCLVHTKDYVTRFIEGKLSEKEIRRLGLPWSKSLVRRSLLATSGTINAAKHALKNNVSSNLAGGTHHAYPDRGEGFCVFNDVAVAIKVLQRDKLAERVLVIDCDVHQGDGTAFIFKDDASVFTFSMHGLKNYPLHKEKSSLDIELEDGTTDDEYLQILEQALPRVFAHSPDTIFYLAGADPYEKDKLGRLKLTKQGLKTRDLMVLTFAKENHVPVVTTMSGGYAIDINDTVEIHANTIRAVKEVFFGQKFHSLTTEISHSETQLGKGV